MAWELVQAKATNADRGRSSSFLSFSSLSHRFLSMSSFNKAGLSRFARSLLLILKRTDRSSLGRAEEIRVNQHAGLFFSCASSFLLPSLVLVYFLETSFRLVLVCTYCPFNQAAASFQKLLFSWLSLKILLFVFLSRSLSFKLMLLFCFLVSSRMFLYPCSVSSET